MDYLAIIGHMAWKAGLEHRYVASIFAIPDHQVQYPAQRFADQFVSKDDTAVHALMVQQYTRGYLGEPRE